MSQQLQHKRKLGKPRPRMLSKGIKFDTQHRPITSDKKFKGNIEVKKRELIDHLQFQIANLSNPFLSKNQDLSEDIVMRELDDIITQAKEHKLKEIQKTAQLAIGKRILNIELSRKQAEFQNKKSRKREIEDLFRENRITKINYQKLALSKLKSNTMIIKPYQNGRGFVESDHFYEHNITPLTGKTYRDVFYKSNAEKIIKHVNQIYFKNFSYYSSEKSLEEALHNPVFKLSYLLAFVMLICCLIVMFDANYGLGVAILALNVLLVMLAVGMSFKAYREDVSHNGQLDETIAQAKLYFEEINQQNQKQGLLYRWNCPDSFMYLEITVIGEEPKIQDQ